MRCRVCDTALAVDFKFCPNCGQALVPNAASDRRKAAGSLDNLARSRSTLPEERKQLTVLFADLRGSLALLSGRDPEDARKLLDAILNRMIEAVGYYEGTVNQVMGDGIMALFGAPRAHEDHAARACFAALRMQDAVEQYAAHAEELFGHQAQIRVGIHTGEVVLRAIESDIHTDWTAVGEPTHLAARMEQLASPGTIFLTEDTHRLVSAMVQCELIGERAVKGRAQPVRVFRAIRARSSAVKTRRDGSDLVGRQSELDAAVAAMMQLQAGQGGVLFVTGEAGVGKSRLIAEATRYLAQGGVKIAQGRAVSYGRRITHWPFIEMVRGCAGIVDPDNPQDAFSKLHRHVRRLFRQEDDDVLPYLATFLTLNVPPELQNKIRFLDAEATGRQVFLALRRFFERLAQDRPLLLILEDLHWADLSSIELLEHLLPLVETAPLLICVTTRPDIDGLSGQLMKVAKEEYGRRYAQILLSSLTWAETNRLIGNLIGGEIAGPLMDSIAGKADGNPFFVEEVVAALVDAGTLVKNPRTGRWRLARVVEQITIPDTIQAVITTRLDRLDGAAKDLLKTASVIGRHFQYEIVKELMGPGDDLDRHLDHLVRIELLREDPRQGDRQYSFRHALVQEVAYNSLFHDQRRQLHRLVGETIESRFADRLEEFYGLLAHHFTHAEAWEKARDYLVRAGDHAGRLAGDVEAVELYRHAFETCERIFGASWDRRDRGLLERRMGEALFRQGEHRKAEEYLQRALDDVGRTRLPERNWEVMSAIARAACGEIGRRLTSRLPWTSGVAATPDIAQEQCRIYEMLGWIDASANRYRVLLDALHALEVSHRAGLRNESITALAAIGIMADLFSLRSVARYFHEWAFRASSGIDDPVAQGYAYWSLSFHHQCRGRWQQAIGFADKAAAAFRMVGHLKGWGHATAQMDWLHLLRGEFRRSMALIDELVRTGRDAAEQQILACGLQDRGTVLLWTEGPTAEAVACLEQAIELFRAIPDMHSLTFATGYLGQCYLARAEVDRAVVVFDEGMRLMAGHGVRGSWATPVVTGLADAWLARFEHGGSQDRATVRSARRACQAALKHGNRNPDGRVSAYRQQGTLAWLAGSRRDADGWWRRSTEKARDLGARYEMALTKLEIGKRLANENALRQALAIFEEIDAGPARSQVQALLAIR